MQLYVTSVFVHVQHITQHAQAMEEVGPCCDCPNTTHCRSVLDASLVQLSLLPSLCNVEHQRLQVANARVLPLL